jgi:hypothetical protein
VHPGTLLHRRQRGIPTHSYENRSQIRALAPGHDSSVLVHWVGDQLAKHYAELSLIITLILLSCH